MKRTGKNKRSTSSTVKSYKVVIADPKDIKVKLVKVSPKVYNDNRVAAYAHIVP